MPSYMECHNVSSHVSRQEKELTDGNLDLHAIYLKINVVWRHVQRSCKQNGQRRKLLTHRPPKKSDGI